MNTLLRLGQISLISLIAITAYAAEKTVYWGPIVLSEGKTLEVCANSAYATFEADATLTFLRPSNGRSFARSFRLNAGEGGCQSLSPERAGGRPVFAVLQTIAEPGDEDLIASAAIVNGIFFSPKPQQLVSDRGQTTATTYGPVRLNPDRRLEVCVNNPMNFIQDTGAYTVDTTIEFFRTNDSSEPFRSLSAPLEPGQGACVEVSEAEVGAASFFAEVRTDPVEPGFPNPMVLSGAFIINGIFESPIPPGDPRFFDGAPR